MPWTILIADDEPKIRRGLVKLLESWPEDYLVVGEAEDGEAALSLASELQPDILLVDIRMPFLNGLELVARLKARQGADRRVIVISGHDEFDYARKAVGLGVFEYLLKPVEEDVLLEILHRASADLERIRRDASSLIKARVLAEKNRAALLEDLFRDGLRGWTSGKEWEETADFLNLRFDQVPQLVVISPVERPGGTTPTGSLMALKHLAEECFSGFSPLLTCWDEADGLAILTANLDQIAWETALGRLELRTREVLALNFSVDRVDVPEFPAGLARVYEELISFRRERSPHGNLATLALNILDRRFREVDLSLEAVANELMVSPGHLSRVLKQSTGTAFVDALSKVRVRKAVILMGDPSVKMYEVAERVGYSSQHYFSRAFRRVLGIAPTDYRKGGR